MMLDGKIVLLQRKVLTTEASCAADFKTFMGGGQSYQRVADTNVSVGCLKHQAVPKLASVRSGKLAFDDLAEVGEGTALLLRFKDVKR